MAKSILMDKNRYPRKSELPAIDRLIQSLNEYFDTTPGPGPDSEEPVIWFALAAVLCDAMFLKARLHWTDKKKRLFRIYC